MKAHNVLAATAVVLLATNPATALRAPQTSPAVTVIDTVLDRGAHRTDSAEADKRERKAAKELRKQEHEREKAARKSERKRAKDARQLARPTAGKRSF